MAADHKAAGLRGNLADPRKPANPRAADRIIGRAARAVRLHQQIAGDRHGVTVQGQSRIAALAGPARARADRVAAKAIGRNAQLPEIGRAGQRAVDARKAARAGAAEPDSRQLDCRCIDLTRAQKQQRAAASSVAADARQRGIGRKPAFAREGIALDQHIAKLQPAQPDRAIEAEQRQFQPDRCEPAQRIAAAPACQRAVRSAALAAGRRGHRDRIAANRDQAIVAARDDIGPASGNIGIGLVGHIELPAKPVAAIARSHPGNGIGDTAAPTDALGKGNRVAADEQLAQIGERADRLQAGKAALPAPAIAARAKRGIAAHAFGTGKGPARDPDLPDPRDNIGKPAKPVAAGPPVAAGAERIGIEAVHPDGAAVGHGSNRPAAQTGAADPGNAVGIAATGTLGLKRQPAANVDQACRENIGDRIARIAERPGAADVRSAAPRAGICARVAGDGDGAAALGHEDRGRPAEGVGHGRGVHARAVRTRSARIDEQVAAECKAPAVPRQHLRLPAARRRAREQVGRDRADPACIGKDIAGDCQAAAIGRNRRLSALRCPGDPGGVVRRRGGIGQHVDGGRGDGRRAACQHFEQGKAARGAAALTGHGAAVDVDQIGGDGGGARHAQPRLTARRDPAELAGADRAGRSPRLDRNPRRGERAVGKIEQRAGAGGIAHRPALAARGTGTHDEIGRGAVRVARHSDAGIDQAHIHLTAHRRATGAIGPAIAAGRVRGEDDVARHGHRRTGDRIDEAARLRLQCQLRIADGDIDQRAQRIAADAVDIAGIAAKDNRIDVEEPARQIGLVDGDEDVRPLCIAAAHHAIAAAGGEIDPDPALARGIRREGDVGIVEHDIERARHPGLRVDVEHIAALAAIAALRLVEDRQIADDDGRGIDHLEQVLADIGIAAIAGARAVAALRPGAAADQVERGCAAVTDADPAATGKGIAAGHIDHARLGRAALSEGRQHCLAHRHRAAIDIDRHQPAIGVPTGAAVDVGVAAKAAREQADEAYRIGIGQRRSRKRDAAARRRGQLHRAAAPGAADAGAAIGQPAQPGRRHDRAEVHLVGEQTGNIARDGDPAVGAGRCHGRSAAGAVPGLRPGHFAQAGKAAGHQLKRVQADRAAAQGLQHRSAAEAVADSPAQHIARTAAKAVGADNRIAGNRAAAAERTQHPEPRRAANPVTAGEIAGAPAEPVGLDSRIAADFDRDARQIELGRAAAPLAANPRRARIEAARAAEPVGGDENLAGRQTPAKAAKRRCEATRGQPARRPFAGECRRRKTDSVRKDLARAHGKHGIAAGGIAAVAGGKITKGNAAPAAIGLGLGDHAAETGEALAQRAVLPEQREPDLREAAKGIAAASAVLGADAVAAETAEPVGQHCRRAADNQRAIVAARQQECAAAARGIGLVGHAELPAIAIPAAPCGNGAAIAIAAEAAIALCIKARIAADREARRGGQRAIGLEESVAAAPGAAIAAEPGTRAACFSRGKGEPVLADHDAAQHRIGPGNPAKGIAAGLPVAARTEGAGSEVHPDVDPAATGQSDSRGTSAKARSADAADILAAKTVGSQLNGLDDVDLARAVHYDARLPGIADRTGPGRV